jgi:DNA polymerase-3 subunit epsilon
VYKRYTGEDFENAHDALADVKATIIVFGYQCDQCPDLIEDDSFNIVSPEGFIKLTEKGELVFTTGKYKGKTTNEICETDPTYIKWIFEKFSNCTRNSIKKAWYAEHPKK